MSNIDDYNQLHDTIAGIGENDIKLPNMPVSISIQEGEDLYKWCQPDKNVLTSKGFDWELVDELSLGLGALREAQSLWNAERHAQEEAAREWAEKSPAAYDLRNTLLHEFRYAYRNRPDVLSRVSVIANGSGHADMIQDLNDLAVLGRENPEPLAAINFDTAILDQAAGLSDSLGEMLAVMNGDRNEHSETKTMRDKAYTYCKQRIDEIRACGQYVFWRNPDRAKGYTSEYIRRKHRQLRSTEDTAGFSQ